MPPRRILCVVGARPNFMKMAPIARALAENPDRFATTLVHTGQHYDEAMSRVFFEELGMPRPDVDLNVGSGSHAVQTAAIMSTFEPVLLRLAPDVVVVVGDVNSTLACALVASKLGAAVAHVEAGLRSFDRTMPEEINRVLTDQISDFLFTTEASAEGNLLREGVAREKIHFVGNVMIDTLLAHRDRARALEAPRKHGLNGHYGLMTLHRPANVDRSGAFEMLLGAIEVIAREVPLVFPVHPRTRPALLQSPIARRLTDEGRLKLLEPLGYLEFIGLMQESAVVLTDSGGIQEETTILGVPCLTLRNNTERPVTVTDGTNIVAGTAPEGILEAWTTLKERPPTLRVPPLWDGRAAERIADILDRALPDVTQSSV
jgi:UDP-N-acetylglucosamine 2-epimerase (non-hydrolysing)